VFAKLRESLDEVPNVPSPASSDAALSSANIGGAVANEIRTTATTFLECFRSCFRDEPDLSPGRPVPPEGPAKVVNTRAPTLDHSSQASSSTQREFPSLWNEILQPARSLTKSLMASQPGSSGESWFDSERSRDPTREDSRQFSRHLVVNDGNFTRHSPDPRRHAGRVGHER